MALSIHDIINNFTKVKPQLDKLLKKSGGRARKSELLSSLKAEKLDEFNEKQLKNVTKFLKMTDEDETVGFLNDYLDGIQLDVIKKNKKLKDFLKSFKSIFHKINVLSGS